jgi:ribose transport system substrate-binding protein
MKQNKVYFGLLICAILAVIAYSAYSMLNYGREETPCRVSVIVDDSSNDRWTAFREGLSQGAADCNMRINVVSTGNHVSLEEEYQTITREIEGGAQGIILQACLGGESAEQLAEVMQNIPLVLVDTDVEPEEVYTCVMPDSSEIGRALADALRSGAESWDQKTKLRVGVLAGNQNMSSLNRRLDAFGAEFDNDSRVELAWVITGDEIDRYGILAAAENSAMTYQGDTDVDGIVALDDTSCGQAVDYISALGLSDIPLYAVGCSEKSVYYLDQGIVTTLIVPDEFNMGYESVSSISAQMAQTQAVTRCTIDFIVADRDNLYDKDVQRMLFPIVQ